MNAPKILIVDDDADSRNLLCEFLTANGYSVESVGDGAAARAELDRAKGYQVVIADLRMPNESGMDMLRNLHLQNTRYSIILMSSFISQGEKAEAQELGARGLLEKPFRLADLLRMVEQVAPKMPLTLSPQVHAVSPAAGEPKL